MVGSFLPANQIEQQPKPKKQRSESISATNATPASNMAALMASSNAEKDGMDDHRQQNSGSLNPNSAASPSSYRRESWATMQDQRNSATDINISLPAG